MKTTVTTAMMTAAVFAGAGCLSPLASDTPTASSNLLAAGKTPPLATTNTDLTSQISTNDGIGDATNKNVPLVTKGGSAEGVDVKYWAFGPMTRAPSPLYMLVKDDDAHTPITDHPPWVDALPGDPAYSAIHTLFMVAATSTYEGQVITTSEALADAIELKIVKVPVPVGDVKLGSHVASPIVLPGTTITLGDGTTATAAPVYGHGVEAGIFLFGGAAGIQPGQFIQPTLQVSYLREQGAGAGYNANHPIFQKRAPTSEDAPTTAPPPPAYTPLSTVVDVDLTAGISPDSINSDDQLFTRDKDGTVTGTVGGIVSTTSMVASFQITTTVVLLQQQFVANTL